MPLISTLSQSETVSDLKRIPKTQFASLCRTFGVTFNGDRRDAATLDRASAAFRDSARVEAILMALPQEAQDAFGLCISAGEYSMQYFLAQRAAESGLGDGETLKRGLRILAETGIAREGSDMRWTVAPGLDAGSVNWFSGWLAGCHPDRVRCAPLALAVAVTISLAVADPPRRTASGAPYQRWMDRVAELLTPVGFAPCWTELIVKGLVHLQALVEDDLNGTRRFMANGVRAMEILRLPAERLGLALLPKAVHGDPTLVFAWTAASLAWSRCGGSAASIDDVFCAAEDLSDGDEPAVRVVQTWSRRDPLAICESLGALRRFGLVSLDPGAGVTTVRRPPAAAPDGRWTVLPSCEVLLPADCPGDVALVLLSLGRFDRVDQVTRVLLDSKTVGRRAGHEWIGATALEILASRSSHPIPENVAHLVREWDRGTPPVRGVRGTVFVVSAPEQTEILRAFSAVREIAPQVFHVSDAESHMVLAKFRKEGVPVQGLGGTSPRQGASVRPVSDLTDGVEVRTAAALAAVAKRPARPNLGLVDSLPICSSVAQVRRRAPRVYLAVRDDPALLRLVQAMPLSELYDPPTLDGPEKIRVELRRMLAEFGGEVGGEVGGEAPTPSRSGRSRKSGSALRDLSADPSPTAAPTGAAASAPDAVPFPDEFDAPEPDPSRPWRTPSAGALSDELAVAVAAGRTVEILYVNAHGDQSPHRVRPTYIRSLGGRDFLDVIEVETGSKAVYRLDRISAIR